MWMRAWQGLKRFLRQSSVTTCNKGPWDYKQQGKQYQEFGNFNYGATGDT